MGPGIQVQQVRQAQLGSRASLDSQVFMVQPERLVRKVYLVHLVQQGLPVIQGYSVSPVQ